MGPASDCSLLARAGRQPCCQTECRTGASARFRKASRGAARDCPQRIRGSTVSKPTWSATSRACGRPPSRWSIRSSATPSWATRSSRRRSISWAILERNGFRIEHNVAGMPTGWMATWGIGQAGDCARVRHRRHTAGVSESPVSLITIRLWPARRVMEKDTTPACRCKSRPHSR